MKNTTVFAILISVISCQVSPTLNNSPQSGVSPSVTSSALPVATVHQPVITQVIEIEEKNLNVVPEVDITPEPSEKQALFQSVDNNLKLSSGERVGYGTPLNQLNDKGDGVVLFGSGDPMGVRFKNFQPQERMARNKSPHEGLRWLLNENGNGLLFETPLTHSIGIYDSPSTSSVWRVENFLPQSVIYRKEGESIGAFQVDPSGNGWVMVHTSSNTVYPLLNYQIMREQPIARDAQFGEVMDLRGNGFQTYTEYDGFKDKLWYQKIEGFQKVGAPELLSANGGLYRVHHKDGHGIISWSDRDEQNRLKSVVVRHVENFSMTSRRYEREGIQDMDPPQVMAASVNAKGDGVVVWSVFGLVGYRQQSVVIQTLKAFMPPPILLIRYAYCICFSIELLAP